MFKMLLICSSIIIVYLSFATSEKAKCKDSWLHLTNSNKCIFYSQRRYNFTAANNYCKKNMNSTLIMITSKEENMQVSKILFDELQFDEYFWLGGRIINRKGDFKWLDSCLPTDYNNFHINNHEFNSDANKEEYLVLASTMNENKSKRKERGTWCSFSPSIMFYALCQYQLSDNQNSQEKSDCELKDFQSISSKSELKDLQSINISETPYNLSYERTNQTFRSDQERNNDKISIFTNITKIQVYFLVAISLMMMFLIVALIFIVKSRYSSTANQQPENAQLEVC